MLYVFDNHRDMLHDELVPKMVFCREGDLARTANLVKKTKEKRKPTIEGEMIIIRALCRDEVDKIT